MAEKERRSSSFYAHQPNIKSFYRQGNSIAIYAKQCIAPTDARLYLIFCNKAASVARLTGSELGQGPRQYY